jgi:hypothetical protein
MVRLHIERLVVDEGVMGSRDIARFETELANALNRLRQSHGEVREPPRDAIQRLAAATAAAVHDRMPRP